MSKTYEIIGPDGKKYRVTAPDDATQTDVMARVQAQSASKTEPENLSYAEMIKRAPQDAVELAKNVPGSLYNVGADLVQAVTSPIETAKSVGGLAKSLAAKVGETAYGRPMPQGSTDAANAFGGYLKDRYGGLDEIRNTLITDPAGAMLDVSGVAIPGGQFAKAGTISRVAAAAEPVNVLTNALKVPIKPFIPKALPETMYRNANRLRFPESLSDADISAALQAGLKAGGIRATEGGLDKLKKITKPMKENVDQLIDQSTARGTQLYTDDIFTGLPELRVQKGGVKVEAPKDLAKIDKAEQTVRGTFNNRWGISPREMQDFKTDAYKKVWDKFSGKKKSQTTADIYHTLAGGARRSIESELPEVAAINARLAPLLDLKHPVRKGAKAPHVKLGNVLRETAPALASTGVGALSLGLGPVPAVIASGLTWLATSPLAKTKIAVALNKIQKGDFGWLDNNLTAAEARIALSMAGREEEQENN